VQICWGGERYSEERVSEREQNAYTEDPEQIHRRSDAEEIEEGVASSVHDHEVGRITDRGSEGCGSAEHDHHHQRPRRDQAHLVRQADRQWHAQGCRGIVCDKLCDAHDHNEEAGGNQSLRQAGLQDESGQRRGQSRFLDGRRKPECGTDECQKPPIDDFTDLCGLDPTGQHEDD